MSPVRHFLLWSVLIILCTGTALSAPKDDHLFGHLNYNVTDDTVVVSYDILARPSADTIWLEPLFVYEVRAQDEETSEREKFILYPADVISDNVMPGYIIEQTSDGLRVRGKVKIALDGRPVPRGCNVISWDASRNRVTPKYKWVEFSHHGALSLSLLPSVGGAYYNSSLPDGTEKDGFAGGLDFFATFDIRHMQFSGSYRFTTGDDFVVKEAIPIQFRYYLGNRTDFLPSASVALKWSAMHVKSGDYDIEPKEWGAEAGVAIEGPFERLSYSYCTGIDGYHKIGLTLVRFRTGLWTIGTQYEYYRFGNTDMFRITGVMEGFSGAGGVGLGHGATDLEWYNNRPWWYKGLAWVGLVPIAVVATVVGFIFGGLP